MLIIHCTQKLLKEINRPVLNMEDIPGDFSGLGNWYSNLFLFNRRKCIVFTNEKTLYTFFVYGVKKYDIESITSLFRKNLNLNLKESGIDDRIINRILMEYQETSFCKTLNRSVVSSMNNLTQLFGFRLENIDEITEREILIVNKQTNKTPMGAIKYIYPFEMLKELLNQYYH